MKVLKQLAVILFVCMIAEVISALLPFAFPASVIAIILLFILMMCKVIKEKQIEETADFMTANMGLVFVPLAVNMLYDLKILKGFIAPFLIIVFASLIMTFIITYFSVYIMQRIIKKIDRRKKNAGNLE